MKIKIGKIPSIEDVKDKFNEMAVAAQSVYDDWIQDENGLDEILGAGGICQDIASKMTEILSNNGVEALLEISSLVGENHVFVLASLEEGVFQIDIPPYIYEAGGGYVWKKKSDVIFNENMIVFLKIDDPMSEDEFYEKYFEQ